MRHLSAWSLVVTLIATASIRAQDPKLAVKLGPDAAAWQVAPYQGKIDAVNIDANARPALAIGPNGLVMTTAAPIVKDNEIVVRFRITLPKGQGSGLNVVAGQKKPGDSAANALGLQLYVYPAPEPESLTWTLNP